MAKEFKEYLQESSLSRLWKHSQEHDYGTITAFRYAPDCGEGTPYTKKENLQRNKSLLAKLRSKGYGVTSIKGSYIENYGKPTAREVGENSFFVADIQDKGKLKRTCSRWEKNLNRTLLSTEIKLNLVYCLEQVIVQTHIQAMVKNLLRVVLYLEKKVNSCLE